MRKSIGAEDTFSADSHDFDTARSGLQPLIEKVWRYCELNRIHAKTITLKVKWADFTQITRRRAVWAPIANAGELADVSTLLLSPLFPVAKGIRLLGVLLSSLDSATIEDKHQLALTL